MNLHIDFENQNLQKYRKNILEFFWAKSLFDFHGVRESFSYSSNTNNRIDNSKIKKHCSRLQYYLNTQHDLTLYIHHLG